MRTRSTRDGSTSSKSNRTARASLKLTPLTTAEVRRLPKPHAGFEAFVEPLAEIVQSYPNDFGTGIDLAAMRDSLARYQALAALRAQLADQLALVDDTRVQLSSAVWMEQMLIYSRARSAARTNADILHAIEKFESFMKTGPQKKPASSTPPAPGTPTSTPRAT
jgi:hypothetical protein